MFIPPPDRAKKTKKCDVPRMNFYYENSGTGKDSLLPKVSNATNFKKMNDRTDILKHKLPITSSGEFDWRYDRA